MNPEVSVLIPLYQCEKYIGEAIESVLAQSFSEYEIIVADDGSADEGGRIASSYPGVRYYRQRHTGVAAARNLALSKAKGSLIAFLDADDLWTEDKLELQVGFLNAHPQCDIVFCRYMNFSDTGISKRNKKQTRLMNSEIPHYLASACIRRELFERFGTFSERYNYGEDTEWLSRLEVSLIDLDHTIDRILYKRRIHDHNISLAHRAMNEKERYTILADAIRSKWRREKDD